MSLKTDLTSEQELMWEKLSTLPKPNPPEFPWHALGRGFRTGEMATMVAMVSSTGKSMIGSTYDFIKRTK